MRSGREFFYNMKNFDVLEINIRTIDECFIASMMTVLDEPANRRKYDYLVFIEFLEMLCRVCIKGMDPEVFTESLAWKVQFLVDKIF